MERAKTAILDRPLPSSSAPRERVRSGIARARAQSKRHGRRSTDEQIIAEVRRLRKQKQSLSKIAKKVEQGRTRPVINQLGAFINQVLSLVEEGILTLEEGQALVDAAQAVIDQLSEEAQPGLRRNFLSSQSP